MVDRIKLITLKIVYYLNVFVLALSTYQTDSMYATDTVELTFPSNNSIKNAETL